jgi:hypothetical protein
MKIGEIDTNEREKIIVRCVGTTPVCCVGCCEDVYL